MSGSGVTYRHGEPAWVDLTTTDDSRALAFYSSLFGWRGEREPIGAGAYYTTCLLGTEPVAGITGSVPKHAARGWTTYFAVEEIDASVALAQRLGARLLSDIVTYRDAGRAVAVEDPQGAVFGLFEAGPRPGTTVLNRPGALCWSELDTSDPGQAQDFYCPLFGYEVREVDSATGGQYSILTAGGAPAVGMVPLEADWPTVLPARWLSYFAVTDLADATRRLRELGGSVALGPLTSAYAESSIVRDPFRNVFCLSRLIDPLRRDPLASDADR